MPNPYDIIFLDVGDTLAHAHPSFHHIIANVLNQHKIQVTAADVMQVEHEVWADIEARRKAGVVYAVSGPETRRFWEDAYSFFLNHLGISQQGDLPDRIIQEMLNFENWRIFPDVQPTIDALSAAGYRLGIISNWEDWLEDLLLHFDVHRHFDLIVFSARENVAKPDPRLYQRAIESAGVPPERAVHVGDDPNRDVAPARSVGMTPVLIDRHNRYPDADCLRITDLRHLPDVLAQHRP